MQGRCDNDPIDIADDVCETCGGEFCHPCMLFPNGPKTPVCKTCAFNTSGIRGGTKITRKLSRRDAKKRREELTEARLSRQESAEIAPIDEDYSFESDTAWMHGSTPTPLSSPADMSEPEESESQSRRKLGFRQKKKAATKWDESPYAEDQNQPQPASTASQLPPPPDAVGSTPAPLEEAPAYSEAASYSEAAPHSEAAPYSEAAPLDETAPFGETARPATEPFAPVLAFDHSIDPFDLDVDPFAASPTPTPAHTPTPVPPTPRVQEPAPVPIPPVFQTQDEAPMPIATFTAQTPPPRPTQTPSPAAGPDRSSVPVQPWPPRPAAPSAPATDTDHASEPDEAGAADEAGEWIPPALRGMPSAETGASLPQRRDDSNIPPALRG